MLMKIMPIPTGMRDVLPGEAAELRFLETAIRRVFSLYGYGEVITPTLELEGTLETAGEKRLRRSFRLFDERGDVMVLRPEMTIPIARLVATRMADRPAPIRLAYFANSFRPTEPQRGKQSEFYQAGLELIGADTPAADAEVLAVLCEALAACGLDDFAIGLGEASFFRTMLDSIGVAGQERDAVFAALVARDMVELEAVVAGLELAAADRQAILDVVALRGGADVLSSAEGLVRGPEMAAALERLKRSYQLLDNYGQAERVLFDLGIFRNFEYYSGIVFEVYSGGLGFPIGGGGRYNALLEKFGRPEPAVGFAIGLDRLHIAVSSQGKPAGAEPAGLVLAGGLEEELELATELRRQGATVFALPGGADAGTARSQAQANNLRYAVLPAAGGYELVEAESGQTRTVTAAELAGLVGGEPRGR